MHVLRRHFFALLLPLLLAGCGFSVGSLWPFGESEVERDRRPANATEYRCSDGKSFYVRAMEGGAAWLIAPDREIRLDRHGEGRYGVGRVNLEITGDEATLVDPPSVFTGCKRPGAAPAPGASGTSGTSGTPAKK